MDALSSLLRCGGGGESTLLQQLLLYIRKLQDPGELAVQALDDRLRRTRWRQDAERGALCNGELDLIFNVIPESPYEGCVQEELFDDEFVVCASADHRLAKRKRVTMADLAHEEWALSVPAVLNVQRVYRAFQDSGLPPPRVAIEARPVPLRLQICAATNMLSFNARRMLQQVAPRFRLKELPVEELKWRRSFGVIYRKDAYLSPAARRLIQVLRAAAPQPAGR